MEKSPSRDASDHIHGEVKDKSGEAFKDVTSAPSPSEKKKSRDGMKKTAAEIKMKKGKKAKKKKPSVSM